MCEIICMHTPTRRGAHCAPAVEDGIKQLPPSERAVRCVWRGLDASLFRRYAPYEDASPYKVGAICTLSAPRGRAAEMGISSSVACGDTFSAGEGFGAVGHTASREPYRVWRYKLHQGNEKGSA
ncbi:MAG: hypothetical protein IJW62_01145 [Clostridia bacterium]|nr:hypothetical protein [Clostridia bacterium]